MLKKSTTKWANKASFVVKNYVIKILFNESRSEIWKIKTKVIANTVLVSNVHDHFVLISIAYKLHG